MDGDGPFEKQKQNKMKLLKREGRKVYFNIFIIRIITALLLLLIKRLIQ